VGFSGNKKGTAPCQGDGPGNSKSVGADQHRWGVMIGEIGYPIKEYLITLIFPN
jgi:hypothetical protein